MLCCATSAYSEKTQTIDSTYIDSRVTHVIFTQYEQYLFWCGESIYVLQDRYILPDSTDQYGRINNYRRLVQDTVKTRRIDADPNFKTQHPTFDGFLRWLYQKLK